jgi:DNA end-binding protein Ku
MWSGTVAFGLVSLPVRLYPAVRSARMSLKMVDEEGTPLQRRYFSSLDERALEGDDIVRGYPLDGGDFVLVEDEELEALDPEKSQEIDLSRFVDIAEVDPMYFERGYFLAPDRGALKAYRLLAKTMEEEGRVGIATFVMRDKEYLVAIIAEDGILRASTLRFHDEVRTPEDVGLPELGDPDEGSVADVVRAIRRLEGVELDRELVRDPAGPRLVELVREKLAKGEDVVERVVENEAAGGGDEPGEDIDLMQVLKQSLAEDDEESGAGAGGGSGAKTGTRARAKPAATKAEARPKPAGRKADADLDALPKAELYQRAQALDIAGRSSMTKDELIAAIRRAQ